MGKKKLHETKWREADELPLHCAQGVSETDTRTAQEELGPSEYLQTFRDVREGWACVLCHGALRGQGLDTGKD